MQQNHKLDELSEKQILHEIHTVLLGV
ncbi:hypothetical protein LCGC14_2979980, partial [marine sediment metagenome]